MGWGRMLLLGNIGQQLDIGDLNNEIAGMERAVMSNESVDREQGEMIKRLEQESRELKLYLATLVRLLVSRGVLKPEEVETTVQAVETKK